MRTVIAVVRGVRVFLHVVYGLAWALIYPALGQRLQNRVMQHWSKTFLGILNAKVKGEGSQSSSGTKGKLIVANHISWLDIFAMNSISPARFIAKSEVGDWPIFGWMVRRAGTLFIRRSVKRDAARVNAAIVRSLEDGQDVALFPQGTSTESLLPVQFHASMLQGAIDAQAIAHPIALFYTDERGELLDKVAFTGNMTFMDSLWTILQLPCIEARLFYLSGIDCQGKTRREVSQVSSAAINEELSRHTRKKITHCLCSWVRQ